MSLRLRWAKNMLLWFKIEVLCKRNRLIFQTSCKHLQNSVNVTALFANLKQNYHRLLVFWIKHLSRLMTKPTKWLCICPVWSESLLCARWVAKDPSFLHVNSDQIGRMPRLIRVFAGRTCHFVGFVIRRHIYSIHHNLFITLLLGSKPVSVLAIQSVLYWQ